MTVERRKIESFSGYQEERRQHRTLSPALDTTQVACIFAFYSHETGCVAPGSDFLEIFAENPDWRMTVTEQAAAVSVSRAFDIFAEQSKLQAAVGFTGERGASVLGQYYAQSEAEPQNCCPVSVHHTDMLSGISARR